MDQSILTQTVFRKLISVMSRPGTVKHLPADISLFWDSGLKAIAATLIDQEVAFYVINDETLARELRDATRGRYRQLEDADFIISPTGTTKGLITQAKRGTPEFPDQGATLIYQVEELIEGGDDAPLLLRGPGIKETSGLVVFGIDLDELQMLQVVNDQYPLGVDLLLVDQQSQVAALPRTVSLTFQHYQRELTKVE